MLHAGVLMKLGGYGCFRIAMFLLPQAAHDLAWIFLILTTISVVYGAFSACVQTDLKFINAYSSVSHCGLVLFALLMMTRVSCTGAILQMLSHGLMTALFFALIGMIYGRTHTRDIRELGGLMKIMPFLSVGYVIAGLANLGLPGFSGFIAEMTIFNGSFENADTFHRCCTVIAITSIVVTAVYILRTVGFILFEKVKNPHFEELTDATWDKLLLLLASLWVLHHLRHNLDGAVRASLLAKRTSSTLHRSVLVAVHHKASTVAGCNVKRSLAVLGILLSALRCEVLLPSGLHTYGESLHSCSDFSEI